ncbi:hypothetical protein MBM_06523 [Drepanopeziza brunnea f. sp. 'multigermtubi' MB_m1]|uniref:Uncharacterized protein n=1 Tax=Marssonina brunnea f. sp. multigermtubi (strain MB_m1) TaxID=1072389 RepID=K1WSE0_MARBU|nr:uncharacterized protein MBM_06523 [Drepanopeziza brunnea f. sp. 'multigermtubi' MB_m1]EKD15307.1 hypothetical protein MBM_06523 [Drepanopeziza brunnea f. sp. 'multigermtubi' MB_m1]
MGSDQSASMNALEGARFTFERQRHTSMAVSTKRDFPQDRTRGQRASLATPPQESPPERALGVAIVRVEMTLPYAADAEDAPAEGAAAPRPSCSKIPIVELLFDEAQRVDRGNLRLLLRYVGDLSARFQDELDAKDREAADSAAEGEAESGGVMGSRGPRATSGTSRRWKEPEPVPMKENFPGLD